MIPIDPNASPSALVELIYRLKVKDIMTKTLVTAEREATLRSIQAQMRDNRVSGVPIVEEERLVGLVCVDDIIRALDQGYIDSPAERHMSRKLVVLEDDMPVSFALSSFEKHRYGRFPVIDRDRRLVGIVTSRDVTSGLLMEMNRALEAMEKSLNDAMPPEVPGRVKRVFVVQQFDYENAGRASTELKKLLQARGIDRPTQRRAAVASYELEMNLVNHSLGGRLVVSLDSGGVVIEAIDQGPGIPDVDQAMTEGFSTANDWIRSLGFGAGMGLPNIKRVSDEFSIDSQAGSGTHVVATIRFHAQEAPRDPS